MTHARLIDELRDKRVGLALSSGYFGFFHHVGVVLSLAEAGISPSRITGNSAGALVGGLLASGLTPIEMREAVLSLKREDYWDFHFPFGQRGFSLLAGHRFQSALGRFLPVHTFETCPIPLSVGVFDMDSGRMAYLDSGPLIPAIYASSAVPYLFAPETIGGRRYWDGGFAEKTPLVPFLKHDDIDIILVSYLPQRGAAAFGETGIRRFLPPLSAIFADVPYEERMARDKASLEALEAAGRQVRFLAPENLRLGPFSMERGEAAMQMGEAGAARILEGRPDEAVAPW